MGINGNYTDALSVWLEIALNLQDLWLIIFPKLVCCHPVIVIQWMGTIVCGQVARDRYIHKVQCTHGLVGEDMSTALQLWTPTAY